MEIGSESGFFERSFLKRNFFVYLELSETTGFKYYQSLLVIFFSFVEFLTANIHCYRIYFLNSGSNLDYIIVAFSYFDVFNILVLDTIVYKTMFYLACSLAYCYCFAYLILLFIETNKIKKHPMTSMFVYFSKYYSWILYFPTNIVLFSRILCPKHVFSGLEIQCEETFPVDDVLSLFLAITGLSCANLIVFINGYFCYSTWYTKNDYFATHYERFVPIYNFIVLIISVLMVIPTNSESYIVVYLSLNLFFGIFLLFFLMRFFPFSKFGVLKMFLFFTILFISINLSMLIDYLTLKFLFDSSGQETNSIYFFAVIFVLFELSFFRFFEYELISLSKSPESLQFDFFKLIKKIRIFHFISSSFKPSHIIYYKGLLSYHFEKCNNPQCFCKMEKVYDAKKQRDLEISKKTSLRGFFAKFLIKNWFEHHLAYNSKDPRPSIFYADFLFNKMKNVHMALAQLAFAERKAFSFNDKRKIMHHKQLIKTFVTEKNNDFYDSQLGFEIIVFLEEQLANLIHLKRRFLKRSVKFWKILENSFLDLTELNSELAKLIMIKKEITQLWGPLKPYLDSKKQLKFYYQWYLKYIMNKKLKVADEEIKTLDATDEEDIISVDSKDLNNPEEKNFNKLIYQNDCCVFHVKSSATTLGNIGKVNSSVTEVFQYSKEEIIGSEITRIMPPFFAKNHTEYVAKFIKNSKMKVTYNTKYAFGMNKNGFIFPIWLILKQSIDNIGALEYISMIKPLKQKKNQADFIILNEYGFIDGISNGIKDQLLLEPEFLKKNLFNILLVSPKLIKYFTYEKYLKKDENLPIKNKKKKEKEKERAQIKKKKMTIINKDFKDIKEIEEKNKPIIKKKWIFSPGAGNKELEHDTSPADNQSGKPFDRRKSIKNPGNNVNTTPPLKDPTKSPQQTKRMNLKNIVGINSIVIMKDNNQKQPHNSLMESIHPIVAGNNSEKNMEESSFIKSGKNSEINSLDESLSSSSDFDTNKNTEQNIITFIIKLPKNLEKHVSYYKELVSKKKDVIMNNRSSVKLLSKTIKDESLSSLKTIEVSKQPTNDIQKVELIPKKEEEKKVDIFEENIKKELKAIVLTADRISKAKNVNIYKIKAILTTKLYGENNKDILKVLKILSIQTKVIKFTNKDKEHNHQLSNNLNEEVINSSNNILKNENEKVFNLSPTLTNKFFHTRTITNELSVLDEKNEPNSQGEINHEHIPSNENISNNNHSSKELVLNQTQEKIYAKSFQKTKNSSNENLFLKEDTMKARRNLRSITKIKWFIRFLFLLIFVLSLLTFFLGPFLEFQSLKNKSDKIYLTKSNELNILQSYNVIMNFLFISTGYFSGTLSDQALSTYLTKQIEDFSNIYYFLINLDQDSLMKNVIYDTTVFPNADIHYLSEINKINNSYQISNKDLLFLYTEKLNNIYNLSDWKIDVSNSDIVFFRTYIVPDIINLLKGMEENLLNAIDTTRAFIDNFMLYILISEVSLLCLTFIILLMYIFQVTNSFQSIIEIFTYIDNIDLKPVKRYFIESLKMFASTKKMNDDDNITEKTSKISKGTFIDQGKKSGVEEKSEQQFKKLKKFKIGNFLTSMKRKVFFYYFLFITVTSCLSIGFFFLVRTATEQIDTLFVNGKIILGMITIDSTLLIALKENVYDSENYKQKIFPQISELLPKYLRLETDLYLPNIDFSNFDQVSTSYFYTNPCISYGRLNSSELYECSNVSLGKLSFGTVSFDNYFFTKIDDYLTLKNEIKFGSLNPRDIYEFDRAIYYINQFFLDILLVWSKDMSSILDTSYQNLTIYLVFMLICLIGAYIIAENLVVGKLRASFKYYRQIYNNFMPTELVSKERLIKAKLVISNVLDR